MDIIVTIPRARQAQVEAEEAEIARAIAAGEHAGFFFWCTSRRPRKLDVGDRVYFLWDGAVRAWHEVTGFGDDLTCDLTGIPYLGCCIEMAPEIHELRPVRHMQPFRGFRYTERLQ